MATPVIWPRYSAMMISLLPVRMEGTTRLQYHLQKPRYSISRGHKKRKTWLMRSLISVLL